MLSNEILFIEFRIISCKLFTGSLIIYAILKLPISESTELTKTLQNQIREINLMIHSTVGAITDTMYMQ